MTRTTFFSRFHAAPKANTPIDTSIPFHAFAAEGDIFDCKKLMYTPYKNAINAQDANGDTALHIAACYGYIELCNLLIEQGADPSIVNHNGHRALVNAVLSPRLPANPPLWAGNDINAAYSKRKETLLHKAASNHDYATCAALIKLGANLNTQDINGLTPLDHAIITSFDSISRPQMHIALHTCAMDNYSDRCQLFVLLGANVNLLDSDGYSALHYATMHGRLEAAKTLIASGASINLPSSPDGNTPLHLACIYTEKGMIQLLTTFHADIHVRNAQGLTPLDIVTRQLQLKYKTPDILQHAALSGHPKIIELLATLGADVNTVSNITGNTALHCAISAMQLDAAYALLDAHANPHTPNRQSLTAFNLLTQQLQEQSPQHYPDANVVHHAVLHGCHDAIRLFVRLGASVNALNHEGLTALALAERNGDQCTHNLLLTLGADAFTAKSCRDIINPSIPEKSWRRQIIAEPSPLIKSV